MNTTNSESLRRISVAILLSSIHLFGAQPADTGDQAPSINDVLRQIDQYVYRGMAKTRVPGVAVGIVYRDRVVYLKGFGVRKEGESAAINTGTVFQLASLSKPLASTVIASLVGSGDVSWDDRIAELDPRFALSDRSVTERLTIRDLLSHRSGLPTSAGDALEDLGFTRPEILRKMRLLALPGEFRKTYKYSNFGFTEAGIAAAKKLRIPWEALAEKRLLEPMQMNSTSYRYSDYVANPNKAFIHYLPDGKSPVARYKRDPDAEAPAGSASSSIRDMAEWLRLQLAGGRYDGQEIIRSNALDETHQPQIENGKDPSTGKPQYYGLGWNVNYDAGNNPTLSHSGAFFLGTGTAVRFSPSLQLGVVVLTNALPTGLAEALTLTVFDLYKDGKPTQDWFTLLAEYFKNVIKEDNNAVTDYSKLTPPSSPAPGRNLADYAGVYRNNYYGAVEFTVEQGSLWMRLPGKGALYTLTHWDGDTFTYRFEEEQGIGTRAVIFSSNGRFQVLIENLTLEGNGSFIKVEQ